MPVQIVLHRTFAISLLLGLSGSAIALEGFDFAYGSGSLFGSYVCFGGFSCLQSYETARSIFWLGFYLLLPGLGLLIAGGLLLRRILRMRREGEARIFQNRTQKRAVLASALISFILVVSFLAPIVPFAKTFPDVSSTPSFPRVDVCYQSVPTVTSPVFEYWDLNRLVKRCLAWEISFTSNATLCQALERRCRKLERLETTVFPIGCSGDKELKRIAPAWSANNRGW